MTLKGLKDSLKSEKATMAAAESARETAKAESAAAEAAAAEAATIYGNASIECYRIAHGIEATAAAIRVLGWTDDEREALVGSAFNETNAPQWAVKRRAAISGDGYRRGHRWSAPFVAARALLGGEQ